MALARRVRNRLAQEGLAEIDHFSDFKEDQLTQTFRNMRTSIPGAPEKSHSGPVEPKNPILVSAK